jgi:site-specific DNA-methyltransferase (adenine-specific)
LGVGFKQKNNGAYGKIKDEYNKAENRVIPHNKNYPCNVIKIDIEHRIKRVHPTQKPIALMEYLIKTYTNENETILDFTMGSGSTGVACLNTNRNFIGIEMDDNYFKIAEKRINKII